MVHWGPSLSPAGAMNFGTSHTATTIPRRCSRFKLGRWTTRSNGGGTMTSQTASAHKGSQRRVDGRQQAGIGPQADLPDDPPVGYAGSSSEGVLVGQNTLYPGRQTVEWRVRGKADECDSSVRPGRLRKHLASRLFGVFNVAGYLCVPNRAIPKRRRLTPSCLRPTGRMRP